MRLAYSIVMVLCAVGCGGGPGGGGEVQLDELAPTLAEAACENFTNCDVPLLPAEWRGDVCQDYFEAFYRNGFIPPIQDAVDRGTVRYDAAAAAECIDLYEEIGCDFYAMGISPDYAETCSRMFVGQVGDGDECRMDQECAFGSHCGGESCPGVCEPRIAAGAACATGDVCEIGYLCRDATCQELFAPSGDGTCEQGVFGDCPFDEVCIGATAETRGTCTPISELRTQAEGETCHPSSIMGMLCVDGLSCAQIGAGTYECRGGVSAGGTCFSATPNMCPEGQLCDAVPTSGTFEGTCMDRGGEGDACTGTSACVVGLACVANVCTAYKENGETCTSGSECYSRNCDEESGMCAALISCG
jgi:hypothetical protein